MYIYHAEVDGVIDENATNPRIDWKPQIPSFQYLRMQSINTLKNGNAKKYPKTYQKRMAIKYGKTEQLSGNHNPAIDKNNRYTGATRPTFHLLRTTN